MKHIFTFLSISQKQNMCYWSESNPQELHAIHLHSQRVTVWYGVSSICVYGPYLFEDTNGKSISVNSDQYVQMLNNFSLPLLNDLRTDTDLAWFQ